MGLRESIILPFVPRFVLIFKPIRIMSDDLMRILVVEPTKDPYVKEIDGSLESMQAIVGPYPYSLVPTASSVPPVHTLQ